MREKNFSLCLRVSILVISLPTVCCSGWKPIAPPRDYFTIKPKTCTSNCDEEYKFSLLEDAGGGQTSETQMKSTLLSHSVGFNHVKSFHQGSKKLDLEIFKPTEVSFFPSGDGKTLNYPSAIYQEVLRPSSSNYFNFKSYGGPGKPTKTIYYSDLELARPKYTNDIKYYKPYKQSVKSDVKNLKPNFLENDLNFYHLKGNIFNEHCSLYKVSFRQDLYYQYVQYKMHMPELKEFTLCLWMRFHNHSHDHSLFSYGAKNYRKAIYMWVSNLNEPGLFNMKVLGQTIFRLNYAIKLYKWYHTCQSWNGNTGEWQVWVNSHRIGRGFHNLLVKHPIPGGGVAISGQEHRHFGKGFEEIPQFLKETGGLEGEITMLQMYKIALTAGKAYNDHSHHHSHYTSTTEEPPELPTEEPSTTKHPLLENGQLKQHVNILELAEALKKGQLDTYENQPSFHNFYNNPLTHSYVVLAPLAPHGNSVNFVGHSAHAIFKRNDESKAKDIKNDDQNQEKGKNSARIKVISNVTDQVKVEKIKFPNKNDEAEQSNEEPMVALPHQSEVITSNINSDKSEENITELNSSEDLPEGKAKIPEVTFGKRQRRHNSQGTFWVTGNVTKRITTGETWPIYSSYTIKKRANIVKSISRTTPAHNGKAAKRHVVFEDPYLNFGSLSLLEQEANSAFGGVPSTKIYDQFSQFGQEFSDLQGGGEDNIDDSLLNSDGSDKKIKKEVELAEGEVRRIMELCSGCDLDPFRKVAVISWRSTPKKIYSGSLFLIAKSECENF